MTDYYARNTVAKELVYLKCPCCGQSRKLDRTGAFARQRGQVFNRAPASTVLGGLDPEGAVFVDFRDSRGGRGRGFPRVRSLTLAEAFRDPAYREQAEAVLHLAEKIVMLGKTLKP